MKKKKAPRQRYNSGRVLTTEQKKVALDGLEYLMRHHFIGNESSAARELGVASQTINTARNRGRMGPDLAAKIATELGTTLERMMAASVDRWPNRTLAVELAREDGAPEERIAEVLALPYDGSPDLSRVEWALRMRPKT